MVSDGVCVWKCWKGMVTSFGIWIVEFNAKQKSADITEMHSNFVTPDQNFHSFIYKP